MMLRWRIVRFFSATRHPSDRPGREERIPLSRQQPRPIAVVALVVGLVVGALQRPPPRLVRHVPAHRLFQRRLERVPRRPAQRPQPARVHRVPPIMPRPVRHPLEQRLRLAQQREHLLRQRPVLPLVPAADIVRAPRSITRCSAAQRSSTYSQSRRCRPSPYSGIGWSSSARVISTGKNFSGYWYGPKLFDARVMSVGSP